MPVSTTTRKTSSFVGNDVLTDLPFTFKVFSSADLYVVKCETSSSTETALTITTDYTVTLNADQNTNPGGQVTLTSALPTGYTAIVTTDISITQLIDIINQGGFYPKVITDALDKLTILIQQQAEKIARSLLLPVTSTVSDLKLPEPSASKFLCWNDAGTGLTNSSFYSSEALSVSSFIATLLDDADAATAAATLGAMSKTLYNANTILAATTDDTPAPVTVGEDKIVGRITGGNITALTLTQVLDMIGSCAEGDILYRTSSGWTRLAKGTALQILRMKSDGLTPEWTDIPFGTGSQDVCVGNDSRLSDARACNGSGTSAACSGNAATATKATNADHAATATNATNADTVDGFHFRTYYNSGSGVTSLDVYAGGAWRSLVGW